MDKNTTPACFACDSHDKLESEMKDLCRTNKIEHSKLFSKLNNITDNGDANTKEHSDIQRDMAILSNDMGWNTRIGYFMILCMLTILGGLVKIHLDNRDDAVHHIKSDTSIIALEKTSKGIAKDVDEIKKDRYLRLNTKELK